MIIRAIMIPYWVVVRAIMISYWVVIRAIMTPYWVVVRAIMISYWVVVRAIMIPYWVVIRAIMFPYSVHQGPEPESLTVGEINGRLYIFIGIERPGVLFVYSMGRDDTQPQFETIFCEGIPKGSKSIEAMFSEREVYAVDPEDLW